MVWVMKIGRRKPQEVAQEVGGGKGAIRTELGEKEKRQEEGQREVKVKAEAEREEEESPGEALEERQEERRAGDGKKRVTLTRSVPRGPD